MQSHSGLGNRLVLFRACGKNCGNQPRERGLHKEESIGDGCELCLSSVWDSRNREELRYLDGEEL